MKKNTSLVILAAGLGSRFRGGIKQLASAGPNGELLIEYSIYDALEAGFNKVIFIIRRDIEKEFKEKIGNKISEYCTVQYCYQDIDDLPMGHICPKNRTKPWGTVHAVLSAKEVISEPFVIINADDHYGKQAYKDLYSYINSDSRKPHEIAMAGFVLNNTISSNGTVTRGICTADRNDMLVSVTETYKISRQSDGNIWGEQSGNKVKLPEESIVSMNMWGCSPQIIPMLEKEFADFLIQTENNGLAMTSEYALPAAFDSLLQKNSISIRILPNYEKWYGMTVSEDIIEVRNAFYGMTDKGDYPYNLFD